MMARGRTWVRWLFAGALALGLLGATPLAALGAACGTGGALSQELGSSRPGGVDFSTLELRYMSDQTSGDRAGIEYSFQGKPARGPGDAAAGEQATKESLDAFHVWLDLPPRTFWVNLNPTQPDRIIDTRLGQTDAGRILLQADLTMKKTVAQLIRPDTSLGSQYWAALTPGPDGKICASERQWIVPAPATVRDDGRNLYILDAPLTVKMESEYLPGGPGGMTCPQQPSDVSAHNESVFRSLVLPRLQQAVNQAPEYESLRRVYLSRVAAEWYRQRSAADHTSELLDSGEVTNWESSQPWDPMEIFEEYLRSYRNGEFNITENNRQYVYGGVDFSKVPLRRVSNTEFGSRWAGLPGSVAGSMHRPTTDRGGAVWLGDTAVVNVTAAGPFDWLFPPLAALAPYLIPAIAGALLLVLLVAAGLTLGDRLLRGRLGLISVLLVLAMLVTAQAPPLVDTGTPDAAATTAWADQGGGQVDYGSTGLSRAVQSQRLADGNWRNTYAAGRLSDGSVEVGRSSSRLHAEQAVAAKANGRSITDLYVEYEPCARCGKMLGNQAPNARVTYSWPWNGQTPAETDRIRTQSREAKDAAVGQLRAQGRPGRITTTGAC